MSDDETQHLYRKLEEHSELLTEIRIAVARIETRPICNTPNACNGLKPILADHEKRITKLERIHEWTLGVAAAVSLLAYICWDAFKIWIKK